MVAQHHGFAAAAGGDGNLAHWRVRPLGAHPIAAYRAAAERVLAAFAGGDARLAPGAAFAPAVSWSGGSRLDQIVAILGRSPNWERTRA